VKVTFGLARILRRTDLACSHVNAVVFASRILPKLDLVSNSCNQRILFADIKVSEMTA